MTPARALQLIDLFPEFTVGVLGDLMLDRYIFGHATRISPEAPVPVVRVQRQYSSLGGAANVMRNLATLGAHPLPFGIIGADARGEELCALCRQDGIPTTHLLTDAGRPTTVKTRVIADRQQLVRIDEEVDTPVSEAQQDELLARLTREVTGGRLAALLVEDYNKGLITPRVAAAVEGLIAQRGLVATLDPHPGNPITIRGLTVMTPNRAETFGLAGAYLTPTVLPLERDAPLAAVSDTIFRRYAPKVLLVTLGPDGMALFEPARPPRHIPTVAREVFDVSGAGDTVIATYTLALLAGATPEEAAIIGNHAAGIVVAKIGTVPVPLAELRASFGG